MEEILKYENRDQLYKFLVDDFGFVKIDEKYYPSSFGNFYIILSSEQFLLQFNKDRSFLTIAIASHEDPNQWLDLSFVRDYIYNPREMNMAEPALDNTNRIAQLNSFLKNDFDLVADLYNRENYTDTKRKINELLKITFKKRFPGALLDE